MTGLMGQGLIFLGLIIVVIGLVVMFAPHIPFLGRLPGDISFQSGNVRIYAPIATSIVISIVLTLVLNLLLSIGRR